MSALESNFEDLVHALVPIGYLSPGNRAQLLQQAEIVRYRRGDHVFKEGDRDPYSIFLLEGRLELRSRGQVVQRLSGGSADATHALAQLQPRKMSARADSDAAVLRVNRDLLERLVASDGAASYCAVQVNEIDAEDGGDWMTRILQSKLFAHLPASNIHRIFSLLEEINVRQDEVVVRQGDAGDYYYIIAQGRCEITRSAGPSAPGYRLALLGPGDTFGEEALVAGSSRNATVRMMSDGELVRLPKEAFVDLIQKPLLSGVTFKEAGNLIGSKHAAWLDVRFPEEHRENGLDGSINHPLNTLRMHSGRLDRLRTYVVYCDTGTRSAVAAFLLAERGFDVHYLEGGLMRYDMLRIESPADLDLSLHDDSAPDADVPHASSGPVPKSHQTAAALSVELAINDLRMADVAAHAERARDPTALPGAAVDAALVEATARARAEAEQAAAEKIEFERQRIAAEIQAARLAAEQAAEYKLREEKARIDTAAAAARLELAEAQRLKAELEQARSEIAQVEHGHAERLKDELERARAEAEHARQAAEQAAQLAVERELAQAERLKAAAEEARLAAERMAASEREQAEAERARADAERVRAEAAAEAARREAAEAQRIREEIELARAQAEAAVAEAARRELAEAQRLKAEIERAKAEADELVRQERAQQRAREEQVRAEMERRLQEEERKLRESYAWQAEELKRLQTQKSEAEARLRDEQERVRQQSEESRIRLAEAREYQKRLQEVQEASEHEAAMREQQQLALERKLREELRHKAQSERRLLEEELARNAAELDRARREREAAEAARHAAAEEAQQIITEFKDALARRRMQEEAEMRFERERLEAESRRLRLALELAQREKETVLENQRRIAAQIAAQIAALEDAGPAAGNATQSDLNALRDEAREIAAQVEERERARADAQAAAVASAGDLAAHKMHEVQVRSDLKQELDDWLREQEASDASEMQRGILANQRAHLERIKQRAQAVRAAAKAHDQALIHELAEKLQRGEVE